MCRGFLLGVLAMVVSACFAVSAQAATYTVGTASDTAPGTTCSGFPSGCSLRQLIEHENAAAPSSPNTISVPAATYSLTQGALVVTAKVIIAGAGARATSIAQTSSTPDRVFAVQAPPSAGPPIEPTVTISGLEITGGTANSNNGFFGGDVRNQGTLTLSADWITGGNTSSGSGAGVSNDGGTLTVTHSLVSGNGSSSTNDSGGIQNYGPNPATGTAGTLEVDNSTIAGNTSALGGGIYSWCNGPSNACSSGGATSQTTVVNSTIAGNDGGTRGSAGGGLAVGQGTISVENSIVANNTVDTPSAGTPSNCGSSGITSLGYNLETSSDCGFTNTGDLQFTSPQFVSGSPQNNGGSTDTLAPALASPAIDHIPSNASGCGGTDQRDIARPQDGACDIGAVEFAPPAEGAQISGILAIARCSISGTPTITWGDGTSSPGSVSGFDISGSHTYAEEGSHTVTISWSDDCGAHSPSVTLAVPDARLTASAANINATATAPFTGQVATFTDADPGGTASDYTATINWGDGASSAGTVSPAGGGFVVSGTHTYANGGSYSTSISVADPGGATAAAGATATVGATVGVPTPTPAPTVTGVSPSLGVPGGGTTVTITGSHLIGANAVDFGSTAAKGFTVTSDGQIIATSPAGTGTVDVTVHTPGGTSAASSADRFTYIPQVVITTVNAVLSAAVRTVDQINPAAAAKHGSFPLQVKVSTPGTLTLSMIAGQNVHTALDAQIARLVKKGTVLARGRVVARHAGKVKVTMKLTAAGKKVLRSLSKALPVQLTANFLTPQGISYTTSRGARCRPRHHASTVR